MKLQYSHTTEHEDFKSHVFKQFLRTQVMTHVILGF